MTRKEAADYLRVTTKTIDRLATRGEIRRYYLAGSPSSPRFKKDELDLLMKAAPAGGDTDVEEWPEPGDLVTPHPACA